MDVPSRPPFVRRLRVRRRRFRQAFIAYERAKVWLRHVKQSRLENYHWSRRRLILVQATRDMQRARSDLIWAKRIAFDEVSGTQGPSSESDSPVDGYDLD